MSGGQYKRSRWSKQFDVKEDLTENNGPFQDHLMFLQKSMKSLFGLHV